MVFSITTVMIGKDNEAISISKYGPLQGRGSKFTQGACYLYARSVTFWLKSCFTQKLNRVQIVIILDLIAIIISVFVRNTSRTYKPSVDSIVLAKNRTTGSSAFRNDAT
jgi:hypothetical protein